MVLRPYSIFFTFFERNIIAYVFTIYQKNIFFCTAPDSVDVICRLGFCGDKRNR